MLLSVGPTPVRSTSWRTSARTCVPSTAPCTVPARATPTKPTPLPTAFPPDSPSPTTSTSSRSPGPRTRSPGTSTATVTRRVPPPTPDPAAGCSTARSTCCSISPSVAPGPVTRTPAPTSHRRCWSTTSGSTPPLETRATPRRGRARTGASPVARPTPWCVCDRTARTRPLSMQETITSRSRPVGVHRRGGALRQPLAQPACRRSVRHVHEAAVVALEGDRDVGRRPVAVLDQHDVGLAGPRGLLLVHVLAVNHHHHVGVLLDRIVKRYSVRHEVVAAEHRGVVDLLLGAGLDRDSLVPQHVVDGLHLQVRVVEDLGAPPQPLAARRGLPHGAAAECRAHGRGEGAVAHALLGKDVADPLPHLDGDRVDVRVAGLSADDLQQLLGRLAASAVDSDLAEEPPLVVAAADVERPAVRVAVLAGAPDAGRDPEPQQQAGDVVDQAATRRRVVHPSTPTALVERDGAVGGPQVPEEDRDLLLRQAEHRLGHELLVAAQTEQA